MSEIRTETTPIRREGRVDDWMHQKLRKKQRFAGNSPRPAKPQKEGG